MLSPEKTSTFPFGSCVAVGYQRATVMSGAAVHVDGAGSKIVVAGSPTSAWTWPPARKTRPSGRLTWPEQKMFTPYGTATNVFVAGFHTRCEFGAAAKPSNTSTLPVARSDAWTVTSGQESTGPHWPTTAGSGGGGGAEPEGTTSIAATSGSSAEPYTDWMFSTPSVTDTPVTVLS